MSVEFWGSWDQWQQILLLCGVILFCLFILIAIITLVYCCCRRRRRTRDYAPLSSSNVIYHQRDRQPFSTVNLKRVDNSDMGSATGGRTEESFASAMRRRSNEQDHMRRESALRTCQFYLRSINVIVFDTHLPDIGSRMSKNWFLVKHVRKNTTSLLTMLPVSQQCRLNLYDDKETLRRLVKAVDHMNVHHIHDVDYIDTNRQVVILEQLHTRGSLKDLLYQTTPNLSWSTKYSICRDGLRLKQIQSFGRQVIHGVLFLHHLGFEPLGQIQSGNIYLEGGVIKVSGYENYLLGYKPRVHRIVKSFKNRIDSVMFGHLIFELSTGREPTVALPSEDDLKTIRYVQIQELLQFIFHNEREIPAMQSILTHPFFGGQNSDGLDHWSYEGVKLDDDMRRIIEKSKIGRVFKGTSNRRSSKRSAISRHSVSSPSAALSPIAQSPGNSLLSRKETSNIQDQSVSKRDEPSVHPTTDKDRNRLLGDIRTGATLKKTVTNDRSAPVLH